MIFIDPVAGIGGEELAHRAAVGAVEVQRLAPLGLVARREVRGRELLEVIAVGPEVVVDDVENDTEAKTMGAVDKTPEVVGASIQARRRKQVDAVIAPAETARKVRQRHYLESGDAQVL